MLLVTVRCNKDGVGADNYICEHTICIEGDDGKYLSNGYRNTIPVNAEPFAVAIVKAAYTVDESVVALNVWVNLTWPKIDILDETSNFNNLSEELTGVQKQYRTYSV